MNEPTIPQNHQQWVESLPDFLKASPVWRLRVYRDALYLFDLAKVDVRKLVKVEETHKLVSQLYRTVGSTGANIVEGYGRNSGKDRQRYYEYVLGAAREADHWYHGCDHVLGIEVTLHRRQLINRICAQLVALIPHQHNIREEGEEYDTD